MGNITGVGIRQLQPKQNRTKEEDDIWVSHGWLLGEISMMIGCEEMLQTACNVCRAWRCWGSTSLIDVGGSLRKLGKGPKMPAESQLEITPELVRKAAELSQIQVTDEEVTLLVPRMEEFIGFVETMEEVAGSSPINDTFGRSDTVGTTFLREDTINKFCNVEAVMENMPLEEGNYLRVPRVGQDDE